MTEGRVELLANIVQLVISVAMWVAGLYLIAIYSHWLVALGIALIVLGNNLGRTQQ